MKDQRVPGAAPIGSLTMDIDLPPPGSRLRKAELYRQLRAGILEGRLAARTPLPPTRTMASALGMARNTVVAVYDMLAADGYVESKIGGGTFVCASLSSPRLVRVPVGHAEKSRRHGGPAIQKEPQPIFDLRLGQPDRSMFPFDVWRRLTYRATRDFERTPFEPSPPAGSYALRQAIVSHIAQVRAIACQPEDCIIISGAQQGFDLIVRALVRAGQTRVAVEHPGYPPLWRLLEAAGATLVPIDVDEHGMIVDSIPADVQLVFVTPSTQMPSGCTLSIERRVALLAFAGRTGAVIVEDDYDGEFRFAGRPIDALKTLDRDERILYVGTFSKCIFSELRLGFILAPRWARDALASQKLLIDRHSPTIPQNTLAAFIDDGHLSRHTRRMRRVYAARHRALTDAIAREIPSAPIASPGIGLHAVLHLPDGMSAEALRASALKAGVLTETMGSYFLHESERQALLLGVGLTSAERIPEAAGLLARAYVELT